MHLQALAERFCSAPLPESVCADTCACMPGYPQPRTGTNLLTVAEAKVVMEHVTRDLITLNTDLDRENDRLIKEVAAWQGRFGMDFCYDLKTDSIIRD